MLYLSMTRTIQQEAFLFSHDISRRVPHVSNRLMELMILDSQELLAPYVLNEVASLLQTHTDLLESFGRLFLPDNTTLEVWTHNTSDETYCMCVQGGTLTRLCRIADAAAVANQTTEKASVVVVRAAPKTTLTAKRKGRPADIAEDKSAGDKKLPALPTTPRRKPPPGTKRADGLSPKRQRRGRSEHAEGGEEQPYWHHRNEKPQVANSSERERENNVHKDVRPDVVHVVQKTKVGTMDEPEEKDSSIETDIPAPYDDDQKSVESINTRPDIVASSSPTKASRKAAPASRETVPKGMAAGNSPSTKPPPPGSVASPTTGTSPVVTSPSTPAKRGRGRLPKVLQPKNISSAIIFLESFNSLELKQASKEFRVSSSGSRAKLFDRLVQHLAITPKMTFEQLPIFLQRYANPVHQQNVRSINAPRP